MNKPLNLPLTALALALSLTACGGGGSSEADSPVGARAQAAAVGVANETWYQVTPPPDPLLSGVTPTATAHSEGMWLPTMDWPINAIHMVLLPSGKLLSYGTRPYENDGGLGNQDGGANVLWDPSEADGKVFNVTRFSTTTTTQVNSFCSSATILADGKVLTAGGSGGFIGGRTSSTFMSGLYSPETNRTERQTSFDTADARWYSTMITLADGRPILLGGMVPYSEGSWASQSSNNLAALTPEIFTAGKGWSFLTGAYSTEAFGMYRTRNEFPHAWVAPNGEVFGISSDVMWALNPAGSGSIRTVGTFKGGAVVGNGGAGGTRSLPNVGSSTTSAVMFAPGKALQMGGNGYWVADGSHLWSSSAATVIDFNNPSAPVLTETGEMQRSRRFFNATVLPDGKVFANGGSSYGNNDGAYARLNGEMWDPATGQWTLMAAQTKARVYHNSSALLPNGTVISGGGGNPGPVFNKNAEIFLPPYLFKQSGATSVWATRPNITGTTAFKVAHGGSFSLEMATTAKIKSLSLLGLTVTTHGFNAGQRRIPLTFTQTGGRLDAVAPNANLTPPGYYMVSAVDEQGVPSKAFIMAVGANVSPPPARMEPLAPVTVVGQIPTPATSVGVATPFSATLTVADAQVSWDFGDGTPATAFGPNQPVQHSFSQPGVYTVVVSMKNRVGLISTYSFMQMVKGPIVDYVGRASSAMTLERRSSGGDRLWVVSPDHNKVSAFTTTTGAKVDITVGEEPRAVAVSFNGTIGVVNKRSATVSLIDPKTLRILRTVTLPRGSQPHGLVFSPDGATGYVALEGLGQVARFTTANAAVGLPITVGGTPRHLAIKGDGLYLAVSKFVTPLQAGEATSSVDVSQGGAEVVAVDLINNSILKTIVLKHSTALDTAVSSRGVPNYLGPMVLSPDESVAWIPSKQDNIARGRLRDGNDLDFQNTVRAVTSRVDLATLEEIPQGRIDHDNASVASAAAFSATGLLGFVTLETSRELAVLNAKTGEQLFRVDVGLAPQAVVPARDGRTVYVFNFMGRSVTVVDLSPLLDFGQRRAIVKATWAAVPSTSLTGDVELGKRLFYDAKDTRLARDSYMSCAACHNDGGSDGRTWDLSHAGEGLRNTPTLRGRMGAGFGKLHWTGNFDEVQDFEGQIRTLAGGTGLMSDAAFNTGTTSQPLGDKKAGKSADLDKLAAYVNSLTKVDASPARVSATVMSAAAQAGQVLFTSKNCIACHTPATQYTNSVGGSLQDVGTLKASSGKRLGAVLTGLDVPTLRGAWNTGPWLHDGSAPTLEAAISAHTKLNLTLSAAELANLAAFVKEIE